MANIKISDLTAAAAATGTQQFEVNDALTSKKVTGAQILSYVQANTTPASIGAVSTADTIAVAKGGTGATTAATARSNLGLVIGTDVLAPNGSGASLTSLNASNISSGTVGTARLATGTADSTTFLRGDGTWASPTSIPSFGAIGSIVVAAINTSSALLPNASVAGSICYYPTTVTTTTSGGLVFFEGSGSSTPRTYAGEPFANVQRVTNGNTGYTAPGGHTTLAGTWRLLSFSGIRTSGYDGCANLTQSETKYALIQRTA